MKIKTTMQKSMLGLGRHSARDQTITKIKHKRINKTRKEHKRKRIINKWHMLYKAGESSSKKANIGLSSYRIILEVLREEL